jgi:hypothetical protein
MGAVLRGQIVSGRVVSPSEQHRLLPNYLHAPGIVASALNGDNEAPIG